MSCAAPVDAAAVFAHSTTAADAVQQSELCTAATLSDPPTHDLRLALQREHCAPRVVAVAFCAALGAAPSPPKGAHAVSTSAMPTAESRAAGAAIFERVWALQLATRAQVNERQYMKGDSTHSMQLRLWQALCVLAPLSAEDRRAELLRSTIAALQHFDLASVKQYQERGAESPCSAPVRPSLSERLTGTTRLVAFLPALQAHCRSAKRAFDLARSSMHAAALMHAFRVQSCCGCCYSSQTLRPTPFCPLCKTTAAIAPTRYPPCCWWARTSPSCSPRARGARLLASWYALCCPSLPSRLNVFLYHKCTDARALCP